jgi:YARHG domain/PEGA domain
MDKVEANNLLRTHLGASEAEVEAAYRKRRAEVRKWFEATRDRNTRTRCEREYFALEQARNLLLAETEDLLKGCEGPAIEREAPPVEREAPPVELKAPPAELKAPSVEREAPPVELKAPPVGREAPPVEREAPPVEREALPVEREALPMEREASPVEREASPVLPEEPAVEHESLPIKRVLPIMDGVSSPIEPVPSPIKRVFGPIERALSPLERCAGPMAGIASPTKRVGGPLQDGSSAIEHILHLKEAELSPLETALTQGGVRPTQKGWPAITGVLFILVSASALVFVLPRNPDKPKQGELVVNTVPDNADVWLDGAPQGKTPLIVENVTPGERQLKIELPGYKIERLTVSVRPGDEGFTCIVQLVPVDQPSPEPVPTESLFGHSNVTILSPGVPPNISPSLKPSAYAGERYPQTRERLLTEAEIADLSYAELRSAINEMYARHGAPFPSEPEIEKQFRAFEWYHPDRDLKLSQIEADFSAIEKKNVDILARLRDQKRPR